MVNGDACRDGRYYDLSPHEVTRTKIADLYDGDETSPTKLVVTSLLSSIDSSSTPKRNL